MNVLGLEDSPCIQGRQHRDFSENAALGLPARGRACGAMAGQKEAIVDIPISMMSDLAAWNGGAGIDLRSWVGCEGRFALAVGYGSIFWPDFVEFDGYILRKEFSETALRRFENREGTTRKAVECVMNHLHIADVQYYGCPDISKDKILLLGNLLKEIYEAKLAWQFPDRPCEVEFHIPADEDDLIEYQICFWQRRHELCDAKK